MNIETIVTELKDERNRVDRAITILEGQAPRSYVPKAAVLPFRRKPRLSAASRKAMSLRMKNMWAEKRTIMLRRRGLKR